MEIYTIGFTQTTAEHFFQRLNAAEVERVLDVRLNNSSQLAGFAKAQDLPYFLEQLVGASYQHDARLAPTQEILDAYKKRKGDWSTYEQEFMALMRERDVAHVLDPSAGGFRASNRASLQRGHGGQLPPTFGSRVPCGERWQGVRGVHL